MAESRAKVATRKTKKPGAKVILRNAKYADVTGPDGKHEMPLGRGWRLSPDGGKTVFSGSLLTCYDAGDNYIALVKVSS